MSLCHFRLPRLILAQCSQQVLSQLQWMWNREYIWIHQSINSHVKTSYVIVTWFELFQIRELPPHPRDRESMKRQQSVEVRKEQELLCDDKKWLWKLFLKELTQIWPRIDSIGFFHQLFLFQVVPSRERWELLSIKISCSCSFFLQIYFSIVHKFKVIAKTTTTYNITFVVYANFWIRNWMLAYENF